MKRVLMYLVLAFFCSGGGVVLAATDNCEQMWERFESQYSKLSMDDKIDLWAKNENKCAPMGYYYYKMAWMHLANGDLSSAKKYTTKGLSLQDDASRYVEYMELWVQFVELSSGGVLDSSALQMMEKDAESLIEKYSKWGMSYAFMAMLKLANDDYNGAIAFAEKSQSLDGGITSLNGRTLGIAYAMTEKFQKALQVGIEASKLDDKLFGDKYFMLSMVRSYIGNEDFDTGAKVLKLLIKSNPSLADDKDVLTFVRFLQNKLKEREPS